MLYCDCAVGNACPVAGRSCTCCSVVGAITGFGASAVELVKGHMVVIEVGVEPSETFFAREVVRDGLGVEDRQRDPDCMLICSSFDAVDLYQTINFGSAQLTDALTR